MKSSSLFAGVCLVLLAGCAASTEPEEPNQPVDKSVEPAESVVVEPGAPATNVKPKDGVADSLGSTRPSPGNTINPNGG